MNNIEFKALIKGLFLTQEQVRQIGNYKDQRQIRRFVSGEQPPHKDLVEKLLKLDSNIDQACSFSVSKAIESAVSTVNIIGYSGQNQFAEWSDGSLSFYELHLCLLFRLQKSLEKLAIKCHIITFDADNYLDFIDEHKLNDDQSSMSAWASQQTE